MKRLLLLAVCWASVPLVSSGQWINNITLAPPNPTPSDTIIFSADVSFPSGSCDQHSKLSSVNGNVVNAYAIHCIGVLTFICGHIDTFRIDPLPAGNYTFHLQLDHGALPSPCTPGIVPGPTDSIAFTVSPASGVAWPFPEGTVQVGPVPATDYLHVTNPARQFLEGTLLNVAGARVGDWSTGEARAAWDIRALPPGCYFLRLRAGNDAVATRRIVVIR